MKIFKKYSRVFTFLSFLIILVFSSYSISALSKFYDYKKAVSPNMELTIDRFHFFLKNELKREWIKLTAPEPLSDSESPLKTFRVTAEQSDIDKLNFDLPRSGKEQYIDAFMIASDDKNVQKIKLRYRGGENRHWLYEQKSLRVKLNKIPYNMELKFNLINPPELQTLYVDSINYNYSKKLSIISPDYFPVRGFLNGKYMGVYAYLSQADESLLRKHKRMPGSIYAGDGAPWVEGYGSTLWKNEKYWEKVSSRNAEQKNNREDIKYFLNSINYFNDSDFYLFLDTFINDKYIKFIAFESLLGGYHHDYDHNHKIYFDPYLGQFEPIQWDFRNWKGVTPKYGKDLSYYPLLDRIKLIPPYEEKRDKILFDMINNSFSNNKVCNDLNIITNDILFDTTAQKSRDTSVTHKLFNMRDVSIPFSISEMERYVNKLCKLTSERRKYILNILNNSKVMYSTSFKNNITNFKVTVDGNSPVLMNFELLSKNGIDIYKDINFNGIIDNDDEKLISLMQTLYPGRKKVKREKYLFYGAHKTIESPLYYSFLFKGKVSIPNQIETINTVTNNRVIGEYKDNLIDTVSTDSIHPWKLPQPKYNTKTLKGIVNIKKTLVFDKYTTVTISPNTTFVMDANTSIYFYGKVTALGTKEKPIKFIAKDAKKPWGLVAVQGKATTGSRFEYVEFENGSVDTRNLIHYTSQFNIHDNDWFEVRNCKIGRNFVGDDAMHIAYAKGIVDNCEFRDARSDGLDIDISDVNITNNIFYKSGNDGLDVMTTTMNASNNIFIDTGDKGISVGEWSEANITDSIFVRTVIGTEIKDKSKVNANNLVFIDSKEKAINLYNKNKRYDEGGFLEAENIYLLGNEQIKSDKLSSYKIQKQKYNLPKLNTFDWYKNIQNTKYSKYINEIEVKYAK